ncbi:MAG: saccharopine dehydrogenase NADP-binding domain-containing protein [Chitinophagaceae bacterium]|nr:saccharopine dehydrogenase NADP-binding domain-containing protein [Chitinophagaceae bacterium]
MSNRFLLFGANGYTGKLIVRYAKDFGLNPVLAGRNESAIAEIAKEFGLEYRITGLDDSTKLDSILSEFPLVLHAAGPFRHTAKQMIEACIRTKTHYIDITGEILVFEMAKKYDQKAKESGIMVMPGVGFDVVPTDCMALHLKNQMPDAVSLQLAFGSIGGMYSKGTATTMAEGAGEKSAVRINGQIVPVALGHKGKWVDFGEKKLFTMTIPWGDVSTAYTTTGIPNIEVYTAIPPEVFKLLKYQWAYNWLLRLPFVRNMQLKKIKAGKAGPTDAQRAAAKSLVWGEVTNAQGETKSARMVSPEGYTLTAQTSLTIAKKILGGDFKTGYQTPAGCYGENVVLEVEETRYNG